jgi:hypothetical protein
MLAKYIFLASFEGTEEKKGFGSVVGSGSAPTCHGSLTLLDTQVTVIEVYLTPAGSVVSLTRVGNGGIALQNKFIF